MGRAKRATARVSVVMAVHNGERWLTDAIQSVQAQSEGNFELLVVDDGSTDLTRPIVESLRSDDARIKLVPQPHRGLAAALNHGLTAASAPLIARLDADDLAHPSRLSRQADELEARQDIAVLGTWAKVIDADGRQIGARQPPADHASLRRALRTGNPLIHSSIMARTDLIRDVGGYRADFVGAEDYDLWLRVSEHASLANLPEELTSYRSHRNGISQSNALRQALSVRLAQFSANARGAGLEEATSQLAQAVDLNGRCATSSATEDEILSFYRWLGYDGQLTGSNGAEPLSTGSLSVLNHHERRLLGRALVDRLLSSSAKDSIDALRLISHLSVKSPLVLAKSLWSLSK